MGIITRGFGGAWRHVDNAPEYGFMGRMKTTLELPDQLLRTAKATAARKGVTLRVFFTEALEAKLASAENREEPWRRHFGVLKGLRAENRRIEQVVESEFEGIDREAWR